jgi:hypothetical protein
MTEKDADQSDERATEVREHLVHDQTTFRGTERCS